MMYLFTDVCIFIVGWKQTFDAGSPMYSSLRDMPHNELVYEIIAQYSIPMPRIFVSKEEAKMVKKAFQTRLKNVGKYGGVPAKIAAEKEAIENILEEIAYSLKHPE